MNAPLDYSTCSDRQLVDLHLEGDKEAFREIVARYQAMVCAFGFSACGDVGRSEDIAQEVFIVAWKQLPGLREPERLRAWLAGIARNLIHQALRRQQRIPTARSEPLSDETPAAGASPRDQAIRAEEAAVLWRTLAGISEIYREPMVLFYRERQSVPAVAATLEISEELVRQRLVRGRAMLTERMAKLVEESLERTAPAPAFAGAVMLSLPLGAVPVAGGLLSKAAASVGTVGGVAAKGGLVMKALSVIAALPALYSGTNDFRDFRDRHGRLGDARTQRKVAWAYLAVQVSFGVMVLGTIVVPNYLLEKNTPRPVYFLLGLAVVAAFMIFRRANNWLRERLPARPEVTIAGLDGEPGVFERRSATIFLGLPLHHIRLGGKNAWRKPPVKAWVAISNGRAVGGLFALGTGAVAPISLGLGAVGLVSLSFGSIGLYALGVVALGRVACGFFAWGAFAAKGIVIRAGELASGTIAFAPHTNDVAATAYFRDSAWGIGLHYLGQAAILAVLLGWVMPLLLTGWHLWQTRPKMV